MDRARVLPGIVMGLRCRLKGFDGDRLGGGVFGGKIPHCVRDDRVGGGLSFGPGWCHFDRRVKSWVGRLVGRGRSLAVLGMTGWGGGLLFGPGCCHFERREKSWGGAVGWEGKIPRGARDDRVGWGCRLGRGGVISTGGRNLGWGGWWGGEDPSRCSG